MMADYPHDSGRSLKWPVISLIVLFRRLFEFVGEILKYFMSGKERHLECFGGTMVGPYEMVEGYSKADHNETLMTIKNEIDFVKESRTIEEVFIIDAGANIGYDTIAYANNSGVQVESFEPFPETFDYLSRNLSSNQITNARSHKVGLFSEEKIMKIGTPDAFSFYSKLTKLLKFNDKNHAGCKSIFTSEQSAPDAHFVRGDAYINGKVDFIKIDVEGAELECLRGLEGVLDKYHPILKVEFNVHALAAAGVDHMEIINFLKSMGYGSYTRCPLMDKDKAWDSMDNFPAPSGSPDYLFQ